MIEQFAYLTKEEQDLIMDAPALITAMVAASDKEIDSKDKEIDSKEVERGLDLMKWKQFRARPDLLNYYQEVSRQFPERLDALLKKELPTDEANRNQQIEERLRGLNKVLPKFDKEFAEQLYASYRELAKRVAESSGGVLGYLSINFNEAKLIKLPMIDDPRTYNV
ncbi:hypothetical protein [Nafulsella turpanensis]|uniref:hypothetical protein n=1 Tax=Nafulsella turpanensis TaxID=1265690 RepID=UPI00034D4606|nr:hypothetical protein [Nafulsella turpanensis]